MSSNRFDHMTRAFSRILNRRLLVGGLGLATIGVSGPTAAKKNRRKKKRKRKCKGGGKTCGKTCIPATSCCSSFDCGNGATCVNGTCACPSGFKTCDGECITTLQCCEACPGGQVCENGACACPSGFRDCNGECITTLQCCEACPGEKVCGEGECACPENAPFECPGDVCFTNGECCVTEGCSAGFECVEGICLCPGADAIDCDAACCDRAADEVCKIEPGDPSVYSCQAGGCPPTDFCIDRFTEQFVCALDLERVCVCTSTTDPLPGKVCVDVLLLVDRDNPCQPCDTSSDCGSGRVCIPGGDGCVCGANFCTSLCPEAMFKQARHSAGSKAVDLDALKPGSRKRSNRKKQQQGR